jgi:hypothetical protein
MAHLVECPNVSNVVVDYGRDTMKQVGVKETDPRKSNFF